MNVLVFTFLCIEIIPLSPMIFLIWKKLIIKPQMLKRLPSSTKGKYSFFSLCLLITSVIGILLGIVVLLAEGFATMQGNSYSTWHLHGVALINSILFFLAYVIYRVRVKNLVDFFAEENKEHIVKSFETNKYQKVDKVKFYEEYFYDEGTSTICKYKDLSDIFSSSDMYFSKVLLKDGTQYKLSSPLDAKSTQILFNICANEDKKINIHQITSALIQSYLDVYKKIFYKYAQPYIDKKIIREVLFSNQIAIFYIKEKGYAIFPHRKSFGTYTDYPQGIVFPKQIIENILRNNSDFDDYYRRASSEYVRKHIIELTEPKDNFEIEYISNEDNRWEQKIIEEFDKSDTIFNNNSDNKYFSLTKKSIIIKEFKKPTVTCEYQETVTCQGVKYNVYKSDVNTLFVDKKKMKIFELFHRSNFNFGIDDSGRIYRIKIIHWGGEYPDEYEFMEIGFDELKYEAKGTKLYDMINRIDVDNWNEIFAINNENV